MHFERIALTLLIAMSLTAGIEEHTQCDYSASAGEISAGYYNEFSLCVGSKLSWTHEGSHELQVNTIIDNSTSVTIDGQPFSLGIGQPEIGVGGVFIAMSGTDYSGAERISLRTDPEPGGLSVSLPDVPSNIWDFSLLALPMALILIVAYIFLAGSLFSKTS